MKIFRNKTFISYIFITIFIMAIEIAFRLINGNGVFTSSLIRVFICTSIIAIIFGYISSLFSHKVMNIINNIIIFLFSIYAWLQLQFNVYIGVYMSVNASTQLGAVKDYIIDFIKAIKPINYLIFIPSFIAIILTIIISILIKKKGKHIDYKFNYYNKIINRLTSAIVLVVSCLAFYISLSDNFIGSSYQTISNKELFISASNPSLCIKNFGISSFAFIDVKTKFYDVEVSNDLYYAMADYKEITDYSREINDTKWNELIANETNSKLNNLNNYYINKEITDKNEYTGIFENKNLIVIMMESVNDIIINEEYFPNFYKLYSEGWYFKNNYSPRNSCATGNNEFSALTGLYSVYNVCTANVYKNNTYYEAMFNLFNNKGYYTASMHDFTEGYYYRSIIHPNMGSQKYYGVQDLGIDYYTYYGGWASDEDFIDSYLDIIDTYDENTTFMNYLTTVSSHQPYNSSPYGDLYYDMTENTTYSTNLRKYYSKLKVLDNALGKLLDGLEERGILDDTVIVLFGDHYPYGIKNEVLSEALDRSLDDYEVEKTPLVIYNSSLNATTYDTYTSYINLTPTLANLFNLDYDPRLYAGVDIFDENYDNIVVFADSSWKNDLAYYNASTGKMTYYTDFVYTDEEIININKTIYAKMNSSTLAVENNYFAYLDKNLNNEEKNKGE